MGTPHYEIRPHHCFKGWYIVFQNGISIGARATKSEAEALIRNKQRVANLKEREVVL